MNDYLEYELVTGDDADDSDDREDDQEVDEGITTRTSAGRSYSGNHRGNRPSAYTHIIHSQGRNRIPDALSGLQSFSS